MKSGKITKVTKSDYTDAHNNIYWDVELENGDKGFSVTKKDPAWFKEGDELSYDVEVRGERTKIKFAYPDAGDGQQPTKTSTRPANMPNTNQSTLPNQSARQIALSIVKDMIAFGHALWIKTKPDYWQAVKEAENYLTNGELPYKDENTNTE